MPGSMPPSFLKSSIALAAAAAMAGVDSRKENLAAVERSK
jgi:hypothetical protein